MTEENKQSEHLADYRKLLVAAEQKSQEDFDKTVLSLSGGALGISFVFLKDVIGPQPIVQQGFLIAAWLAWAFSTFSVLTSYYLSHLALRRAISQVDNGTIYKQSPGGTFACLTAILNATGAILFLAGVCCITVFAVANLPNKRGPNDRKENTIHSSTSDTTTSTPVISTTNPSTGQSSSVDGRLHSPSATPAAAQK
ncbi:MAG TPA: hypothetical protein VFK88_12740 [Gallionella sp.]|nr:hypothetical protein [Gallionella sp.]